VPIQLKRGVRLSPGMHPALLIAVLNWHTICERYKVQCVITSGSEGTHTSGSKHYNGRALDFRTRCMTPARRKKAETAMRSALGQEFVVLLESDHLHVQWEPIPVPTLPT